MKTNIYEKKEMALADLIKIAFDQIDGIYKENHFNYHEQSNLTEIIVRNSHLEYELFIGDISLAVCDLFLNGFRDVGISCVEKEKQLVILFHCSENPKNIIYRVKLNKSKIFKKNLAA